MPKRSNEFQRLVYLIKKHVSDPDHVTESKMLCDSVTGAEREVDICIETVVAGHKVVVCIECRNRKRRDTVEWIDEMKSKHEGLPTNVLVLISHSGFTKGAKTKAEKCGIELLTFKELNDDEADRLFGEASELVAAVFSLSPTKVVVGVTEAGELDAENVVVKGDHAVFNFEGEQLCSMDDLVQELINSKDAVETLALKADNSKRGFKLIWRPCTFGDGQPMYLEKLEPKILRLIKFVNISGDCNFDVSKFKLSNGRLGDLRIAWGTADFLGKKSLLVASAAEDGQGKITISPNTSK